jgi:hypothetical protein
MALHGRSPTRNVFLGAEKRLFSKRLSFLASLMRSSARFSRFLYCRSTTSTYKKNQYNEKNDILNPHPEQLLQIREKSISWKQTYQ